MKNKFKLDNIDIKILQILQENARISNIDLSEQVGVSPSPCLRRVRALEENGYVNGYYADLNQTALNMEAVVFVSIKAEFANDLEREEFETELAKLPEIRDIFALATETDFLCKVVATNYQTYKMFVHQQLARVPHIKQVKSTHVRRTIKNKYGIPIINQFSK